MPTTSNWNGFAQHSISDTLRKITRGSDINPDTQGFFESFLQPSQVEESGFGHRIHQDVEIAIFLVFLTKHRAVNARIQCAMLRNDLPDHMMAVH